MHTVHFEPVPKQKFKMWHEILVATGGRYLSNPTLYGDTVRVDYMPGDYLEQCERWNLCNLNVVERMSTKFHQKVWNRFKLMCKVFG